MKLKCTRCGYEWESKVATPRKCPRCFARLETVSSTRVVNSVSDVPAEWLDDIATEDVWREEVVSLLREIRDAVKSSKGG